jgi:dolichyl-phosphate-mannose-protein mannosyltransferase
MSGQAASRPSHSVWLGVAGIVVLVLGGSLAVAYSSGAIDIPYGDDWSFSRSALALHSTGEINLVNWGEATLIGHLVWALPFLALGSSLEALHWASAVAGAIGLVASFFIMRRFLSPALALLGTLLVGALPYYSILATTYMTDITGFAAQMVCLALGLAALDREGRTRWMLLGAAVAVGLFAFSIREIGLVAPLAVMGAHLVRDRGRPGFRPLLAACGGALALAAVFYLWRQGLAGDLKRKRPGASSRALYQLGQAYFTLAIGAFPALLAGGRTLWEERRRPVSLAAAVAAVAVGAFVALWQHRHHESFNLSFVVSLLRHGQDPDAFLPGPLWAIVTAATATAGVLLALALARAGRLALEVLRGRSGADPGALLLALFAVLYGAALVVRAGQGEALHDRYLLGVMVPLLVFGLAMATGLRDIWRRVAYAATAVALGIAAVGLETDKYASASVWDAADQQVARGARPNALDAGFAWVGFHASRVVGNGGSSGRWADPKPWYAGVFPASTNCLIVSPTKRSEPQLDQAGGRTYDVPAGRAGRVIVYRNPRACG